MVVSAQGALRDRHTHTSDNQDISKGEDMSQAISLVGPGLVLEVPASSEAVLFLDTSQQ